MRGTSNQTNGWWFYPVHLAIAVVGAGLLGSTLVRAMTTRPEAERILIELPYFPVQVSLAFAFGLAATLLFRQRSATWIWIVPAAALGAAFLLSPLPVGARMSRFFGWACRPEFRCFVQAGLTEPFYGAVAYSLGAFAALHVWGTRIAARVRSTRPAH